ncbi:archaeosortase/exosortase family protein [Pantanalinema rosaneae CENA516]|uniref:archaeosortase/exosortase family protein n=1 Tax=Pantanalinema rosaneae TaxID=1620701 RepID=UPI003D6FD1A4
MITVNNVLHKLAAGQWFRGDRPFALIRLGIGLAALHLILTWRLLHQFDQLVLNAVFWLAILGVLIQSRHQPNRDRGSRWIGLALLGVGLVKSLSISHPEAWFVRLFPALMIVSLILLISGFQFQPHGRIGLLLMPLMLPRRLVEHLAEQFVGEPVQVLTAQFAAFMLHYIGYDAVQQNTIITLNQGGVDVLFRCTGIPLLIVLLQLALLCFGVFSLSWSHKIRLLTVAAMIAFLISGLRVAMMAVVVSDRAAFDYWHGGTGSQLFSTGAIVLFGWCCQRSLPRI